VYGKKLHNENFVITVLFFTNWT